MKKILLCVSLMLTLCVTSVSAEDKETKPAPKINELLGMSLEELLNVKVTTLSRSEEARDLAPGSIYVFDAEMIQKRGYRSLGDLLRVVPGFTVFHKGLHLVVGVRGLNANENEKVTLLINGRESNNVQEPDFLNGPINLQTLERVEVVVGPSSFFQRANTLAATINIITKKVDGVELSVGSGTDTPYSASAVAGKRWSADRFVTASLTVERKDGFDAWDENNRPTLAGHEETGQLDDSFFVVLEGQTGDYWGQVVAYESNHPELNLNTPLNPDGSRVYDDATYTDRMFLVNLKHHLDINDDLSLDTLFDAGYKEVTRRNKHRVVGPGLELEYPQRDYAGEFALQYRGMENHYIYSGLQFSYEDNRENFSIQNGTTTTLISSSNNSQAAGIYLYDRWQVTESFKTEGGLRLDYNNMLSDNDVNWGGRLAFVYELPGQDNPWITKLIVNRAVRYPSPIAALNEAWGIDKPDSPAFANRSSNATKPEILSTVEWQNIVYWKNTRLSANIYYQELKDFISWFQPHTNVGDFSGHGIELELQYGISDTFTVWANASMVDSELDTFSTVFVPGEGPLAINDKSKILGSPAYTVNAGFDNNMTEHFILSGQIRYFTDQAAFDRAKGIYEEVDNRVYIDLTATYMDFLEENVDLGFIVQNLLDNRDHVSTQWNTSQYKPRGRSLLVELQVQF